MDGHFAAAVADEVELLNDAGGPLHVLSVHAEHVGEELLGEVEAALAPAARFAYTLGLDPAYNHNAVRGDSEPHGDSNTRHFPPAHFHGKQHFCAGSG